MAVSARPLFEALQAQNVQTTQYSTPAATRTIIDKFTGTNVTAAAAVLTVNIVGSGGSAGVTNAISTVKSIAPGEAYTFPEVVGHVMSAGDFISTLAGTAAAIVIRASGREIT